jgi:hypothetical protein
MLKKLNWKAYSNQDRHHIIDKFNSIPWPVMEKAESDTNF